MKDVAIFLISVNEEQQCFPTIKRDRLLKILHFAAKLALLLTIVAGTALVAGNSSFAGARKLTIAHLE